MPFVAEQGDPIANLLGVPPPPPENLSAPPKLGTAPTVSSTPGPGQGVALTASGVLPPSAAATGIRMLTADPASPLTGEFWYRVDLDKLSVKTASGVKRTAAFT
jgi:hypothetical protein